MEPIVSAGLVYLAHRTMPFLSWTPPHRLLSLYCAEDIMSTTTLLIILLVLLFLGGGGFYARRRW
jgi:hypothetical protein